MARRTFIATTLTTAALAAVPGAAFARPADRPHTVLPVAAPSAEVAHAGALDGDAAGGSGSGSLTVLVVAGGTLLAGAAGGFGGGRVITRRDALRP